MKRALKKIRNTRSGQALVEFALVLPLLLTVLCGILDFGWMYLNQYEVNHAAYEGARYAEMHMLEPGMNSDIVSNNVRSVVMTNLTHTYPNTQVVCEGLYESDFPKVTVRNPVRMLTFVGGAVFGNEYTVEVTETFAAPEI